MKNKIILFLAVISFSLSAQVYSDKDVEICNSTFTMAASKELKNQPIGDVITTVGMQFLGTDYEAFALEKENEEQLVINLTGLDCTTFLENTLVFSRMIKAGKSDFTDYQKELTFVRYRDGKLSGYPSRLHYFSDWIFDNTRKGLVEDVTKETGGEKIRFKTGFMSSNPDKYKQLKSSPEFTKQIKSQEEVINKRDYYYIPKNKVSSVENKIQNGDLIAITTNQKGLDIGHVGIAVKKDNGRIHFMHAPLAGSKVQISEDPLPVYLSRIKKHTGIIILRPLNPPVSGS
jgi:hypothetical protein